jgi:hypothetical protein
VRLVKLTSPFLAHRALRSPSTFTATEALGRTIATLSQADSLPEPGDATTLVEPDDTPGVATMVHVRRVPGFRLWIWYRDAGAIVELVALTNRRPLRDGGRWDIDQRPRARAAHLECSP